MGEKGNITSEELATAAASSGLGAVVAGAGTQVTAVFEDAGGTIKDKIIDKGADAGIASAQERWRRSHPDDAAAAPGGNEAPPTAPT